MASHLRTELIFDALEMAAWRRRPDNVFHHSDQGCQYASLAFGKRCREAGIRPSTGSVGDRFDSAMCESYFATLEYELLERYRFATQAEARAAVFKFLEGVVQHPPAAFGPGLPVADALRSPPVRLRRDEIRSPHSSTQAEQLLSCVHVLGHRQQA